MTRQSIHILDDETKLAPTNYDKITELFPNDIDWIYDFTTNKFYNFAPGGVSNANAATFPAMTRLGMTLAILNLGPCSMLPPHYHPRATNVVVAIAGTTHTYMINENGVPIIEEVLTPMKMTIFPHGSMHMMYNAGELNLYIYRCFDHNRPSCTTGFVFTVQVAQTARARNRNQEATSRYVSFLSLSDPN